MRDPRRVALFLLGGFTGALASACDLAGQGDSAVVSPMPAITTDGRLGADEWAGAGRAGTPEIQIEIGERDGFVQIGVRTPPLYVASVCVAVGDTVRVFHASSALGDIRYARDGAEWRRLDEFEWRLRATGDGPEANRERGQHLESRGWVANTVAMGEPGETEFRIAAALVTPGGARLAIGLMLEGDAAAVTGWPPGAGEDGCTLRETIAGPPPARAVFDLERWLRLVPPGAGRR